MSEIDAKVAARKIRSAISELLDGAQGHLEDLEEQGRLADEQENDEDGPSDEEIDSTKKVIDALDEIIEKFDSIILPELFQ